MDRKLSDFQFTEITVLELFSGTESFSKEARKKSYRTFTVELNPKFKPDLCKDLLEVEVSDIPFKPTIIWASPPCQAFSVASIGHHWTGGKKAYISKTDKAILGMRILEKTIKLIQDLNPQYYIIENPRGLMRKMEVLNQLPRHTVTYCKYGDKRMKPTDLWTNINWTPRPMCHNYKFDDEGNVIDRHCHHETARRGARTGTQGLKGNMERSIVPKELCREILETIESSINGKGY